MTELFEDLGSVYLKIHTIAELNGVEDEPDAPVGNNENEKMKTKVMKTKIMKNLLNQRVHLN